MVTCDHEFKSVEEINSENSEASLSLDDVLPPPTYILSCSSTHWASCISTGSGVHSAQSSEARGWRMSTCRGIVENSYLAQQGVVFDIMEGQNRGPAHGGVSHIRGVVVCHLREQRMYRLIAVSVTLSDLSVYYQHTTTMLEVVSCPFSMRLQ